MDKIKLTKFSWEELEQMELLNSLLKLGIITKEEENSFRIKNQVGTITDDYGEETGTINTCLKYGTGFINIKLDEGGSYYIETSKLIEMLLGDNSEEKRLRIDNYFDKQK